MRMRLIAMALLAFLATGTFASAQQQTGEIFGKVTDQSGAVLPGATVTVTAPNLLQPLIAVTSGTGSYEFPRLEIGVYTVKFELTGFKTVVNEGIRITIGFNAQINAQMSVSTVQETITVTGETPIVDVKDTGTKQTFTNDLLQGIPSARDPWVIIQQTAGVAMDRENIGGNMSGQQSNYTAKGGFTFNNKWSLDGVDITDMAATGASPSYYDFDAFDEITISTGGSDVTQQTGGVGINLVTKSGSDKFRGSGRLFDTNHRVESQNITDSQRLQGATSGNPIQDIQDYGIEVGGPIKKGRAWIWGSFGKQLVDVGVLNFYQPTAGCQQIKADEAVNPLAHAIGDVNNCLSTDETLLQTTNLKAEIQLFKGNKLTVFNNFAKKQRNARGADDLHPIETTNVQSDVPTTFGAWGWTTGPNPTYKVGDQYVLSDRLLLDVQWAHIGNNFVLDFHDPSLTDVQSTLIIPTSLNGRSGTQNVFLRPVQTVNVNMNYFMPGVAGGDHAFKIGGYWKDAYSFSQTHRGGNATVRFPTSVNDNCAALAAANPTNVKNWCQVDLWRDSQAIYDLLNVALYAQDTITHNRLTLSAGVRYDRNHDQTLSSSAAANPILPQWLPAINFPGADPKVVFNNFSPRLGLTYSVTQDGKTVAKAEYARYYGQVGTGGVSQYINPITEARVRFPWNDANGDKIATASEINASLANVLAFSGNYDPSNPGLLGTANTIDPNLKNDTTDEVIVGVDRELAAGFAVGVNYTYRRYGNFGYQQTVGQTSADYTPVSYTPAAANCPSGCPTVTYFQPNFLIPGVTNFTNVPGGFDRTFNGIEVNGRKRLSHHWLMNTSFAYNNPINHFGTFPGTPNYANGAFGNSVNGTIGSFTGGPEDPTNRTQFDGAQYAPVTSGSGIGNVYVNSKWLFKAGGMYQLPYNFNISAFYNARQGYPFARYVQSPTRINGAGIVSVWVDPVGTTRLPNYQDLDFHVERPIVVTGVRLIPSFDLFNISNANTEQAIRGTLNATTANNIQAIVAPRVARFGVRVAW
jgi:hypothetical protein